MEQPVSFNDVQTDENISAQQPIKVLKTWTSYAWVYHGIYWKKKLFYAEVAKSRFSRKVTIHHQMIDGSWQDFPMNFLRAGGADFDVWAFEDDYSNSYYDTSDHIDYGNAYAIKLEVNGKTYWDNNNGNNYIQDVSEGMYLRDGLNISADTYTSYLGSNGFNKVLNVEADVRNIAFQKEVTLVYTTNNWQTTSTAPLNFAQYYSIGNGAVLPNPNVFGIERWTTTVSLPLSVKNVQYAISYKVNGQTFWDNNYGRNYRLKER
jgi:hypothetical protein